MTSISNGESAILVRDKLNKLLSVPVNAQTGTTYTLVASDELKLITFNNAAPVAVTVPSGLGAGFSCTIAQLGAGTVTLVAGSGVTVNSFESVLQLAGQFAVAKLSAYAANIFIATGALFEEPLEPPIPIGAAATTSAGIFDSTDKLVRVLWNTEVAHPDRDNPAGAWDGTLEDGTVAPTGEYIAKVIAHEITYTWEGAIGHTSPNHTTLTYWNYACPTTDMEIYTDGKMWHCAQYHERLPVMGYSTTTNIENMTYVPVNYGFRDAYVGALFVTTDGTMTYYAFSDGGTSYVQAINYSTEVLVSFPTFGVGGSNRRIGFDSSANNFISSVAVQRGGSFLFITRAAQDKLLTLNKSTGEVVQTNSTFDEPSLVEVNPTTPSQLWLLRKVAGAWKFTKCTVDGAGVVTATATETSATLTTPFSSSISPDGATLLVADAADHKIRAFNTSDASLKTAFGASGLFGDGGYDTNPNVTNTKWLFKNLCSFGGGNGWVAYAPDGSFWIGDSGNNRHLHFSSGNSPTYIEQVMYQPAYYACGVCANDPTRVFIGYHEFSINYSLPLAPGNGSWTYVRNWGGSPEVTLASSGEHYIRLKYVGTYADGRTYAVFRPAIGRRWCELTATGLRNTGVTIDNNTYIDAQGHAYYTWWRGHGTYSQIVKNPFTGLDGSGNPTWQYPTVGWAEHDVMLQTVDLPTEFPVMGDWDSNTPWNHVEATENNVIPFYDPNGFRGFSVDHWTYGLNHLGGLDATTGEVKFHTYPTSNAINMGGEGAINLIVPEIPFFIVGSGVSANSGGVFVYEPGQPHIFVCHIGEGGWGNNQINIWHHYHDSGLMMKRFGVVAPYFAAKSLQNPAYFDLENPPTYEGSSIPTGSKSFKGQSEMAGNTKWGGHAFVGGKMYLYQSDEWYHNGIHRWCIDNLDSVYIAQHSVDWDEDDYVAPMPDPNDLLSGLSHDTALTDGMGGWTRTPTADITTSFVSGPFVKFTTSCMKQEHRRSPDLTLEVKYGNATPVYASKAIPRVGVDDWTLTGKVYLYAGDKTSTYQQQVRVEILDNTGKIIFSIYNFEDGTSSQSGCKVNEVNLTGNIWPSGIWESYGEAERVLIVAADVSAGTMQVTYGDFTVSRTVQEVGADLASPATVRLRHFSTVASNIYANGSITELHYSEP